LRPADDAVVIDTTGLAIDEVVDELVVLFEERCG
jgi:cytidylate kinase